MGWERRERRGKKRYGIKNSTVQYRRGGLLSVLHAASPPYLLLNVSDTGCHLITKEELRKGETLALTIQAPKMEGDIHAKGRVIWCRRSDDVNANRVGIRFLSLSGASRTLLRNLLDGAILENVEVSTRVYLKELEKL